MKYLMLSLLFLTGCIENVCVEKSTPIKYIHDCDGYRTCAVEVEGAIILSRSDVKIGDTVCLKYERK